MKALRSILLAIGITMLTFSANVARAQFMPIVYDNVYGKESQFIAATADFQNGDVVIAGINSGRVTLTWLDRNGESRFSKRFNADELSLVSKIIPIAEDKVLIIGCSKAADRAKKDQTGRGLIMNSKGGIERNLHVGEKGTLITHGELLANGNLILSGSTPHAKGGSAAFICKVSPKDRVIYSYTAATGETCDWFNVLGSRTEYLNAAFSSQGKEGSSVVRLDENGKPYFITTLPDPTFKIERMISTVDGDIFLVGQGTKAGGAVIKIRQEGDIVFQKQIVPVTPQTRLDKLIVCPTGEILVGGNDKQNSFYALLRADGTELSSNVDKGVVAGIVNNSSTGDCMVSIYMPDMHQGKIIKLSKQGRKLFEKMTAASYTSLRVNVNGDLLMGAPQTGRLTMISSLGEMLFDRFVVENTPSRFADVLLPVNGEALFMGVDTRVAKLAHGVYVSDIQVNKPINGYSTALFTVTLSGYAFSNEGAPKPVTVNYKTRPITASEGVNYDAVSGTLSFVPSTDGSGRYLNKFEVEVPVIANNMLEGERTFALDLEEIKQSYLIKPSSVATIEDQPAVVKLIATTAGMEGEKDVTYTLGIFKTNGTPLTNATQTDIVIDGIYGNGTADKLDFDMGRLPRLTIAPNAHSGAFHVATLEDTRYESLKTVVVNFNKIYAMSDTHVSFGSNLLSCEGQLYDQAALVAIESLGNHTKLNNVLSGLFKVTLIRAKDGALLTNNSGSDIVLTPVVNENSTAKQGVNFVLSNGHDLRIWGDDKSSAVNLTGMVLYSPESGVKTVSVSLKEVKAGANAGKIGIAPTKNSAQFTITNK